MKRGGIDHPKTHQLAEALGIRRVHAVGLLEMLFHFTAQYAPEGDIGRYADKRIAAALDWCGSVSKLIDSLVATRWVDRHPVARLVLHGWDRHADRATLQKLSRMGKKAIQSHQEDAANLCTQSETAGFNLGSLPEPEPEPAAERVLTHTPNVRVRRRAPNVINTDKPASPKFAEWWDRWCELTKLVQHKDESARTWITVAKTGDEAAIFGCLERYGASDQVYRGVIQNPDRWLYEQARSGWKGDWPLRRAASGSTRQQQAADAWKRA